jgi:hypothetical protein
MCYRQRIERGQQGGEGWRKEIGEAKVCNGREEGEGGTIREEDKE